MKFKTLIFIFFIPILAISQSISMGNPIPFAHGREVTGNSDLGYFSHEWIIYKGHSFKILEPTSFKIIKTLSIDDSYFTSAIIKNKAFLFYNNKGTITYNEIDLKTGKESTSAELFKYDYEVHPEIKIEFTKENILVLISTELTHLSHFVRGAEYHANMPSFENFTGSVFAFDLNFKEAFQSNLEFKLNGDAFHLRDLKISYNDLVKEFYVITDIVTTGTLVKKTTVMEFKRFFNVIDEEGNNEIKEINFDDKNLVFGYNVTNVSNSKNIGQRLIMNETENKMKVQTFSIGSDKIIAEKDLPLLSHHTFDVDRYLSGNGFFLSSDLIKNETLDNGNILSLHRINLDHGKYWSGSRFKNYYFLETTIKGEIVDVKGVPVFDRNGAAISKNRFFYIYDDGFFNIVYIDNYADQKDKSGKKLDGNYLVAATLGKDGKLTRKVLTHEGKYDKTSIYRLLQTCFINKNGDFITYAFKKKKEDAPFTIKF